jgi:hypothetical protein
MKIQPQRVARGFDADQSADCDPVIEFTCPSFLQKEDWRFLFSPTVTEATFRGGLLS